MRENRFVIFLLRFALHKRLCLLFNFIGTTQLEIAYQNDKIFAHSYQIQFQNKRNPTTTFRNVVLSFSIF